MARRAPRPGRQHCRNSRGRPPTVRLAIWRDASSGSALPGVEAADRRNAGRHVRPIPPDRRCLHKARPPSGAKDPFVGRKSRSMARRRPASKVRLLCRKGLRQAFEAPTSPVQLLANTACVTGVCLEATSLISPIRLSSGLIQARFAISLVTRPPTTRQHGTLNLKFLSSHVLDFG